MGNTCKKDKKSLRQRDVEDEDEESREYEPRSTNQTLSTKTSNCWKTSDEKFPQDLQPSSDILKSYVTYIICCPVVNPALTWPYPQLDLNLQPHNIQPYIQPCPQPYIQPCQQSYIQPCQQSYVQSFTQPFIQVCSQPYFQPCPQPNGEPQSCNLYPLILQQSVPSALCLRVGTPICITQEKPSLIPLSNFSSLQQKQSSSDLQPDRSKSNRNFNSKNKTSRKSIFKRKRISF
jgi:hypothetical protein